MGLRVNFQQRDRQQAWSVFVLGAGLCLLSLFPLSAFGQSLRAPRQGALQHGPAPADNPLKGFVPYCGNYQDVFPHSMEWAYFPLAQLMDGPQSFTFTETLEPVFAEVASRGHQVAMRVFIDYPTLPTGLPEFLQKSGVRLRPYEEHGGGRSPDYDHPLVVAALESFIRAFGKRYDGDPRLGFITIGLLGFWGEWHTYPHQDWFPSLATQNRVLHAYTTAFRKTKLLMRYPAADGVKLPLGFHDDSFAYSTLSTVEWHFLPRLRRTKTLDRWRTEPIGGELRPEVQAFLWKRPLPTDQKYEDFDQCVRETHCTWLINQHVFNERLPTAERARARAASSSMGYELSLTSYHLGTPDKGEGIEVIVNVENRGVAPFYYDWPVLLRLAGAAGDPQRYVTPWRLSRVLPKQTRRWRFTIRDEKLSTGSYRVSVGIPNPLANGQAVRFANEQQGKNAWLELAKIQLK